MANEIIVSNIRQMKQIVNADELKKRVADMLGDQAGTFLASALDLYTGDSYLAKCNPNDVMKECLKAAALHLPISKTLGLAYVVPYNNQPQFQIG